ncbi:unnamed protein product [Schistosoma margrebowiei]|uniref:Integrin alpha third immunoglobulin-like domain-containing protein n=1 Tax=Schistosoma margrebowiei TaxID=48269 RepID=A0AA84ZUG9_9TREM|nr:unnamed protein product [Schistosoma margrebowiei]
MWIMNIFCQSPVYNTIYHDLFIIILYTLLFNCIHATIDDSHILNDKSYSDINWENDYKRSHLWSPKTPLNVWPDFKLIQQCDTLNFNTLQFHFNQSINDNDVFEWTSISLFNSNRLKRGYILLGGSYKHQSFNNNNNKDNVSPRYNSQMILCYLNWKSDYETLLGFGFNTNSCIPLLQSNLMNSNNNHEYLGATSQSLKITQDLSVFIYCDPLWRANSLVPIGRCFLHLINNGVIQSNIELAEFCQTNLKVFTPCAAGHSIALTYNNNNDNDNNHDQLSKSINDLLSNIQLWIGQPLSTPYGRIQILTNLYNTIKVTTINRPESNEYRTIGSLFGYALTDGFVTAPGLFTYDQYHNNTTHTNINHLFGIHYTKSYRDNINGYYDHIDWYPEINDTNPFNGNGISVLRVNIKGPYLKTVIIGAPYTKNININNNNNNTKIDPIQLTNYNIGRIYLLCQLDSYKTSTTIIDYLDGPYNSRHFGFSLTNLGDYDGDGNDDIAVGAPYLKNNISSFSYIYFIRLLSNCKFDRIPLNILKSPQYAYDYGAYLPNYAEDLDFNGNNDLVVPISSFIKQNILSNQSILIYATRDQWIADCHYLFPPWLTIRNLLKNDIIPIQIIIYFNHFKYRLLKSNQINKKLISSLQLNQLIHQINPDWNITNINEQRFHLMNNSIQSLIELKQNQLIINFNIQAKINIEEIYNLESINHGIYIGYRFLQLCYSNQNVINHNGICLNGSWLKRPYIDWSKCISKLPLTRYICYPYPICQSDLILYVKDIKSNQLINFPLNNNNNNKSINELNQNNTNNEIIIMNIDIEYGNKNSSRQQIQIELYNLGPTQSKGTRMELQFHGNLKFSHLELEIDTVNINDNNNNMTKRYTEIIMVDVSENETWVNCPIGTLLPLSLSSSMNETNEIIQPNQRFLLSTYYDQFMLDQVDFQLGAGITIHIISGTLDPQPMNNIVRINYHVIHRPNIRISYGPGNIPSKMDNRTIPLNQLFNQKKQRIIVSEIGPKVEHIIQIEYMGPSNQLKNVTMNLLVPIELDTINKNDNKPQYILYMFNEIRSLLNNNNNNNNNNILEWMDSRPKIYSMSKHYNNDTNDYDDISKVGSCMIVNSEKVVNPREFIPMDVNTIYSRKRRNVLTKTQEDEINMEKSLIDNGNESFSEESVEAIQSSSSSSTPKIPVIQFRRLQKEVFECNRVGNRIQKPPICAEIICHVDELVKNRPVLIKVTGWLWARTLFAKHISDVDLVTIISVNQGDIPNGVQPANEPVGHFYLSQTFFFPQIRPKLIHQLPIWPIIVGIVLGVLFLYLLIILLYLLGFFHRRKTELRKAMLSKGGADDTYKREQTELLLNDQMKLKQQSITTENVNKNKNSYQHFDGYTNATPTPPPPPSSSSSSIMNHKSKKLKKKHKRELNILHPGDLSPSGTLINTHQDQNYDRDHHHGDDEQQNKNESEKQNLITDSTSSQ